MPVKARRPKCRADDAAMVAAWSTLFETGYDFFHDLSFKSDTEAREAAREVWARYGCRFLDSWQATLSRDVPWALETFGEPRCR